MLLALSAIWGASFMFIKVGVRELDPITLVGLRLTLGVLTLAPIVALTLGRAALSELRAAAWPLALTGVLNSALPIWSLSWAETRIDSGLAAVIQASAPLFTALLALATLPPGLARLPSSVPDWKVIGSVVVLGIGGTGLAYVLYYALLAGAGASRSILVTYLVPALALGYGALLLGEEITVVAVAGLALVLGGVALGTGAVRAQRRARVSADTLAP